jgi:hypothetical protein
MTIGEQDHPDKHADGSADHQNGRQKISSFGKRVGNWLTRCTRYICKRITIILCWSVYPFSIETIPQYLIASFTLTLAIFAYYAWDEATRGTAALKEQAKTLQGQLDMRMRPEFLTQPASSSITLRIQVSTTSHPSDNP